MAEEKTTVHKTITKNVASDSGGGAIYGMGLIGALIYFMTNAVGFGGVLLGIVKAILWPGYVVYELLESFYG